MDFNSRTRNGSHVPPFCQKGPHLNKNDFRIVILECKLIGGIPKKDIENIKDIINILF